MHTLMRYISEIRKTPRKTQHDDSLPEKTDVTTLNTV